MRPSIFEDRLHQSNPLQIVVQRLEKWLTDQEWKIEWTRGADDCVDFGTKIMVVNTKRTPQSQMFGIMHEIGHIILFESSDYTLRFPACEEYKYRSEKKHESLRVRAETFGIEWEAWSIGERLTREMKLDINYAAFRSARDRDLKSYAKWMVNG